MISLTIKEIRTPGVKFKEFLALNQEDEVQLFQFEDEIFSGRVFDKIYSEFSEIISKKKIISNMILKCFYLHSRNPDVGDFLST